MIGKGKIIQLLCLGVFVLIFGLPHIQYFFTITDISSQKVSVVHDYHMPFNFTDWFKGRYQLNSDRYFKENFGYRDIAVRTFNQVDYTVFSEANANSVVIGKDGYLYEQNYIDSYFGIDYRGEDTITAQVRKLRSLQDVLFQKNKRILSVIAPGKGFYFPEFIPDKFDNEKGLTNYETYTELFKLMEINHIDFNSFFLNKKTKTQYPLYSKNGIHWSYYGLCMAADSILNKVNTFRPFQCGLAYWDTIVVDKERAYDYDIAGGMNLLQKLDGYDMGYPNVEITDVNSSKKPRVLVVADSYYWGMFNFNVAKAFGNNTFWYYNRQVFPDSYQKALFVDQLDLKKQIDNTDVIIIICTEGNLSDFGWGFVEQCYDAISE